MSGLRSHQLTALILYLLIFAGYLVLGTRYPDLYIWATMEDMFGEWLQFYFFSMAMVLSLWVSFSHKRFRLFFGVLALACFYVAMEEISWGQRIFNISTPQFFKAHNIQNETNIHNIFVGPIETLTKQFMEYGLAVGLTLYSLVYPLALRYRWQPAIWMEEKGLPSPPLYLSPFFVTAGWLEPEYYYMNEAEVAEILLSFAFCIMASHYEVAFRLDLPPHGSRFWRPVPVRQLTISILQIFLSATVLAAASSYVVKQTPRLYIGSLVRFDKVSRKHANAFKNIGQWRLAARLYHIQESKFPDNTFTLRQLVLCYRELGDEQQASYYMKRALGAGLKRLEKNRKSVSANLNMVHTYRLQGDEVRAREHLDTALAEAKKQVEKNPESGSAFYWLGQAQAVNNDFRAAAISYARAVELKPNSTRNRKALFKAKKLAARQPRPER
ncbi:MAG: hypothetical protein L3J03_02205 [Desulfobacterales bacterium]|nr:hypothetical protein [Desulfobacterales bacterium]